MSSGYAIKEMRYATRLSKRSHEQVNLCGACGIEVSATELLCKPCRGTLAPSTVLVKEGSDDLSLVFWR